MNFYEVVGIAKDGINGHDGNHQQCGLGNEHAIKGVAMRARQGAGSLCVLNRNMEFGKACLTYIPR